MSGHVGWALRTLLRSCGHGLAPKRRWDWLSDGVGCSGGARPSRDGSTAAPPNDNQKNNNKMATGAGERVVPARQYNHSTVGWRLRVAPEGGA